MSLDQSSLIKALYTLLSGDATLGALVTGVYSYVPSSAIYPYISLTGTEARDWSAAGFIGSDQVVVARVYSRQAGEKEAADILNRLSQLLDRTSYTVEGHTLVQSRVLESGITRAADGITFVGMLRLRVLLQQS